MRISRIAGLGAALLLAAACHNSDTQSESPGPPVSQSFDIRLQVVTAAAGLDGPMDLQAPPGDPRLFIAERPGRIRVVQGGVLLATPFLDIASRVYTDGEAGLISFTFDPQFSDPQHKFVYVHFVENIAGTFGDILVERYQVSASDPNQLDVSSVVPAIRIPHRDANNHYGGRVAFGPDGMLYLSVGDGGGSDNQFHHAQDAASNLGKLMRLDVSALDATHPPAIPPDNPMWPVVGQNANWAIGLRNPFRYAFDGTQLYIADVGQNLFEEIDVVDASEAGLNYGWSVMEGTHCFADPSCDMSGLTLPVYDYGHNPACAIIGGYVYRGAAMPEFQGTYFFSDLCTGIMGALTLNGVVATVVQAPMANAGSPHSFGQDGAGEIYVLNDSNEVLKIVKP